MWCQHYPFRDPPGGHGCHDAPNDEVLQLRVVEGHVLVALLLQILAIYEAILILSRLWEQDERRVLRHSWPATRG